MGSIRDLFGSFGGVTAVAATAGVSVGTASAWQSRNSIPPEYWSRLVAEAARRGLEGVTLEALASIAAQRKAPTAAGSAA